MLPVTSPMDAAGDTKVFALASVSGLTQWVDYVPVQVVDFAATVINKTDSGGFRQVNSLAADTGLLPFKDYIPVFVVTGRTMPWNTDDTNGYIPMYAATGALGTSADGTTFANVIALLAFDGTDGQTTTVDSGPDVLTVTLSGAGGGGELDTAIKKYGTAACLFNATGNNNATIILGDQADMVPTGTQVLTVEMDYYPNNVGLLQCLCGNRNGTDGWAIYQLASGEINIQGYSSSTSRFSITSTVNPTQSQWNHIAVQRNASGNWKIWVGGAAAGNANESAEIAVTGSTSWIIGYDNGVAGRNLTANIDNFRAINEIVYTGAFTPPAQAHPTS